MAPRRFSVVFALVLILSMSLALAAKEDGLTGSIEAFRVIKTEEGKEDFVSADRAKPKDVIEYRLTYKNSGKDPVQNIFITDPIPSGTEYVESSASEPKSGSVEFSVDGGKTYGVWPIEIKRQTKDGREVVERATPDMVTHIRWTLTEMFKPDGQITVSYRTLIK
jgi:uncharacterized repeat protein (TIGR01451 family)